MKHASMDRANENSDPTENRMVSDISTRFQLTTTIENISTSKSETSQSMFSMTNNYGYCTKATDFICKTDDGDDQIKLSNTIVVQNLSLRLQ